MRNEPYWVVVERLEEILSTSRKDDDVLLHFGCHGLKDDGGGLYLAARNTRPQRLVSTGIDSAAVIRMMRASPAASAVLLLDCCFAGAFARGMLARTDGGLDLGTRVGEAVAGGRGLAVVTASSATEWAFEKDGTGRSGSPKASVFTRALVEGIRTGDADRNEDGLISLQELYDYVAGRVRLESPQQTPNKWEFGVRESLFIARSPRRRVTAARLPAEIQLLLDDSDPRVRKIGVSDLEVLVWSQNMPIALAALRRLEELTDDDSRLVSAAAANALRSAVLEVSAAHVDLGLVRPGPWVPPAIVELSGPPLTQLSLVRAPAVVRAWIDGGRLLIRAAHAEPGLLSGTVALTGPTGTTMVEVTGWSLPDPHALLDRAFDAARTAVGVPLMELLVLLALAFVAEQAGDQERATRMLGPVPDLLRAITDKTDRTLAAAVYAWTLARSGQQTAAEQLIERLRATLQDPWAVGPVEEKALATAETAREVAQDAVQVVGDMAKEAADPGPAVVALAIEWAAALIGTPGAMTEVVSRAETLVATAVTSDRDRALCLIGLAGLFGAAGHVDSARGVLATSETIELADIDDFVLAGLACTWVWTLLSDPDEAARLIGDVASSVQDMEPVGKGVILAALGWLTSHAGDEAEARSYLDQALAIGRDSETGYADRVVICLAAGWAAAHLGFPELGADAAAVVDEQVPEGHDTEDRVVALVVAGLVAAMSERVDLHDKWLRAAAEIVDTFDDNRSLGIIHAAISWIQALVGPRSVYESVEKVVGLLDLEGTDEASHDPFDPFLIARVVLVLAGSWSESETKAWTELATSLLADMRVRIERSDPEPATALLATAAAWVAVQVGDRIGALGLLADAAAITAETTDPLMAAWLLAAQARVCAFGDRPPHPLVRDLVSVLLPTEHRIDRTATVLDVLTRLTRLLLPGG